MIDITNNMMTFSYVDVDFGCALSKCHDLSLNSRQTQSKIHRWTDGKQIYCGAGKWYLLFVIYSTKHGLKLLWYAEIGTEPTRSTVNRSISFFYSLPSLSLFSNQISLNAVGYVLKWPRICLCMSLLVDVNWIDATEVCKVSKSNSKSYQNHVD